MKNCWPLFSRPWADLRVEIRGDFNDLKGDVNKLRGEFNSLERNMGKRMDDLENEVRKLSVRINEIAVAS